MSRRALAAGCLAAVAAADYVTLRRKPSWLVSGPFDHAGHLGTSGLLLLNLPPRSRAWTHGFFAGSLLPDLDHLPLALRRPLPSSDDPRPVSHCLLLVAPVAALAAATGSERLAGGAAGVLAHFARDLGVGTGVPLAWPATRRSVRLPYAAYAAACLLLARRATLRDGL